MHHGKSRGKRKIHKACKKHVNLLKTGEFLKVGGKNNFLKIEGEMYGNSKNRGI